jgi:hypothetical protein
MVIGFPTKSSPKYAPPSVLCVLRYAAFHVRVLLFDESHKLRGVYAGYPIVRIVLHPGHFQEGLAYHAVLAAGEGQVIAVLPGKRKRVKALDAVNTSLHFLVQFAQFFIAFPQRVGGA